MILEILHKIETFLWRMMINSFLILFSKHEIDDEIVWYIYIVVVIVAVDVCGLIFNLEEFGSEA
jgi:hypothetical protein